MFGVAGGGSGAAIISGNGYTERGIGGSGSNNSGQRYHCALKEDKVFSDGYEYHHGDICGWTYSGTHSSDIK